MRNGIVTSASPPQVTEHGDTTAKPVARKPSGMTLSVNDVVVFEMVGRAVWVTQKMVAA